LRGFRFSTPFTFFIDKDSSNSFEENSGYRPIFLEHWLLVDLNRVRLLSAQSQFQRKVPLFSFLLSFFQRKSIKSTFSTPHHSMTRCSLDAGSLYVSANQVTCNGTTASWSITLPVEIVGTGDASAFISISDADIDVFFFEVKSTNIIAITRSSAKLFFEGRNEVQQIACAADSNVSLAAIAVGSVTVNASGRTGAGIGTPMNGRCASLVLCNGSISVEGARESAVIGAGRAEGGASWLGSLVISGGNITAVSNGTDARGAGIGTGYAFADFGGTSTSRLVNLMICDANVTARCNGTDARGAGIGPGSGGTVDDLRLSGNLTVRSSLLKASSILLSDGWFVFITISTSFLKGTLSSSGTVNLAILYSTVIGDDSQDFSWLNRTVLHLGNVSSLDEGGWSLRLLSDSAGIERSLFDEFHPVPSLVLSVRDEGFYWISCEREGQIGLLAELGDRPGFWVNSSGRFVREASLVLRTPTPVATVTPMAPARPLVTVTHLATVTPLATKSHAFTPSNGFSLSGTFTPVATATRSPAPSPTRSNVPGAYDISFSETLTVIKSFTITYSRYESSSRTVVFSEVVVLKETVSPSLTFVDSGSALVDVATIVGVKSPMAVESFVRVCSVVSVELLVAVPTVSHMHIVIPFETLLVAEKVSIARIIGAVTGGAGVFFAVASLRLSVRRNWEKKCLRELYGNGIDEKTSGIAGGRSAAAVAGTRTKSSRAVKDREAPEVTSAKIFDEERTLAG
jgi:hypothetical protein